MAAEETEFPLVVRGYDRAAVDDALRDLRREILQLSGQNAQLATELRDTSNRLIEAQQTISEVGEPTYAGVGAKAALILSTAEEQAKRLIQDAEQERDRIRKNLAVELDEQRGRSAEFTACCKAGMGSGCAAAGTSASTMSFWVRTQAAIVPAWARARSAPRACSARASSTLRRVPPESSRQRRWRSSVRPRSCRPCVMRSSAMTMACSWCFPPHSHRACSALFPLAHLSPA